MSGPGAELSRSGRAPVDLRTSLLGAILVLALVRGLIYLALLPPWQHYDEPTHFEYVRFIAQRGRLPSPDDLDLPTRLEIAASMQASGFWRGTTAPPIEFWSEEPAWIGVSELQHPPLYYGLAALTQVIARHQSVEVQLYLARLGSILLSLVVVASAYGLVVEAFPSRRMLPFAVAAFVAFLPPFTDLMSSVNNDAGAAAATSLLLWVSIRTIRRGLSLGRAAALMLLAAACIGTKSTSGAVAVAALLTLAAGSVTRIRRRWLWIGLAGATLVAVAASFTLSGHAAHWYNDSPATARNRVATDTPLGEAVLRLGDGQGDRPRTVYQELKPSLAKSLRGIEVSFGAWLRVGEGAAGTVALNLHDGVKNHWHLVQATGEWQFYEFAATIDPEAPGVAAYVIIPDRTDAAQTVYADGLVLESAAALLDRTDRDQGKTVASNRSSGEQAPNLLRNPSAESQWPALRGWIGRLSLSRNPVAVAFHSLWDWTRTGWVYTRELSVLFRSFWGTFGWNHLSLGTVYFAVAGVVTVGAIVGCGLWLVRHRRSTHRLVRWQKHAVSVLAVALTASWIGAIMRIHPVFATKEIYWPVARYAITAIVPTTTVLCFGLKELVPSRLHMPVAWTSLLALVTADAVALLTVIVPYYYG